MGWAGGTRGDAWPVTRGRSADPLLDAKLQRPPSRHDWIERARLMKSMDQAVQRQVVLVAAPPGYGKTTMVTQWLASHRSPPAAAWVSLDAQDNDPVRLWTHVSLALDLAGRGQLADGTGFFAPEGGDVVAGVMSRVLEALRDADDDVVIVLDDFHALHDPDCHEQVEVLIEHLPSQAHLVIATRADPGLRLARLRANGRLAEIRAADLAFTADEVSSLFDVDHIELSDESVQDLTQRTEGWAAGIRLAMMSVSGRSDPDEFIREVSGSGRFIVDYLAEEVLAGHSNEVREFIRVVSVLDRFSAPLCDFLTGSTGSATVLRELERTNLFLVPLDEGGTWFRFHHLFASVVRNELEFEEPERVPTLHRRAAQWFREHGHVDEAVKHTLASGSTDEAARIVQVNWLEYADAGRAMTVASWLKMLEPASGTTDLALRVTAAWMAGLSGDRESLKDHLGVLAKVEDSGPLPDGTRSVASAVGMLQGVFGFGGPAEMTGGAQQAVELETDGRSPFYAVARMARGHAAYVTGDLELAASALSAASQNEAAPASSKLVALAVFSLTEGERGREDRSLALAQEAVAVAHSGGPHVMPQASLAYSALARALAATGNLALARDTVERGRALHREHPVLGPWGVLHHLLAAGRVAVTSGELAVARHLTDEASLRMDRFGDGMRCMRERLHLIQQDLPPLPSGRPAGEPLTERELDVLHLLQGSLTLNEIASALYVSNNTVKTHVRGLYRKLGVASRADAVRAGRALVT